ncbi:phosphoglycerate dehydrogenase [Sabulicella glaciei]|uniref:D-3-phosphoglycerate dehydrogenase n=1 Tax=Sabulicella glaciei TaxID=2984948 RepID=A0ABT3NT46_9PROT|nr:phosphoglycerate dehydrogenase [Roseococcus sp. MDT2-1-1]MCW8085324.1 phosphoglycerate dehydrogenase [Roseococcus sp. MDT2-1-1]
MPERLSLAKGRIRALLLENISLTASALLAEEGYTNVQHEKKALEGAVLADALRGVHMLGIRSRTTITEEALRSADRLMSIGCFCIGTNQVDLEAARQRGIPVFNAPFSNTRSVAELTLGEIVMLLRGIFPKSVAAHAGDWDKSADGSREVRGRTLGIVGYGNIGSQLSVLAEAFGMRVIYYDRTAKLPLGNASRCASLAELLHWSDIVTLHVPETADTMGMIGAEQIAAMKPGAVLVNNARGTLVDLDALARALRSGHLAGAALDVFPEEPKRNGDPFISPVQGLPNVILTPHIGGSTEEAQSRIGEEVARKLADYSDTGSTVGAVNFPQVALPARPTGTRFMHVHRNAPGVLGNVNQVFAKRGVNIAGQYLQTDGEIGYVVVDAGATRDGEAILEELRALPHTIRARLLYERE